ncbi:MAG: hypothetical protein LBD16_04050 [Oscillospiraceae bacterium]|jgi:hypothetical protein|nr:hypothetical protein [Oscillospiraceae bacterium]
MILIHQDMIMRLTLDAELEEPNNLHEIRDVLIKYLERVEKLLDENLVRPVLRNRRQVFGTFC